MLKTRREIHRIAIDRVMDSLAGADIAGDDHAGMDPDPRHEFDAGEFAPLQHALNLSGRPHRLLRMLRVGDRDIERHQHRIAQKLVHNAAVAFDRLD